MPIDASILNEVEHLRELNLEEKAALAEKIDLLRYSAGQAVFNYGDPGHALYIVRSGEVEIYVKNDQGEKIVLETSQPGDIFGESRCSTAARARPGWPRWATSSCCAWTASILKPTFASTRLRR